MVFRWKEELAVAESAVEARSNMHTKISSQTGIKKRKNSMVANRYRISVPEGETGCGRSDERAIHPQVILLPRPRATVYQKLKNFYNVGT